LLSNHLSNYILEILFEGNSIGEPNVFFDLPLKNSIEQE